MGTKIKNGGLLRVHVCQNVMGKLYAKSEEKKKAWKIAIGHDRRDRRKRMRLFRQTTWWQCITADLKTPCHHHHQQRPLSWRKTINKRKIADKIKEWCVAFHVKYSSIFISWKFACAKVAPCGGYERRRNSKYMTLVEKTQRGGEKRNM